jgi:hypothetical protein
MPTCRTMHAHITSPNVPRLDIPPTSELFSKEALVERHPNLPTPGFNGHCETAPETVFRLLCMNQSRGSF